MTEGWNEIGTQFAIHSTTVLKMYSNRFGHKVSRSANCRFTPFHFSSEMAIKRYHIVASHCLFMWVFMWLLHVVRHRRGRRRRHHTVVSTLAALYMLYTCMCPENRCGSIIMHCNEIKLSLANINTYTCCFVCKIEWAMERRANAQFRTNTPNSINHWNLIHSRFQIDIYRKSRFGHVIR